MTKLTVFLIVLAAVVLYVVTRTVRKSTSRHETASSSDYVRDEEDSVKAFYQPYAEFTAETPESTDAFVAHIEQLTGLPRHAETYPTENEKVRDAARAFSEAARVRFDFAVDLDDPDPTQLDRFANRHLIDENVREFFDGDRLRDLSEADAERYQKAIEALTLPNEPLLYYAMGSFWGEWLVRHRGATWALYDPLNPVQSFPDMLTTNMTVCMHPYSQVVKKFTDPEGDLLSFKAEVFSTMKKYFAPYPLTASISDAEAASNALLPPEAADAMAHEQDGRLDEAFRSYVRAIENDPDNARLYALGVSSAWQLKRWNEVESWLREGLRLAPDNPVLLHNLAVFYSGTEGGLDRALELLERALEIDPRYGRAHITIASCLKDQGRIDEARQTANWVLENEAELEEEAKAFLASIPP